ncbi:MAG: hypothetical protein IKJ29_02395, partial [Akkermansia sp.]|nr:hypothetical protein [Akkermansia sp.]
MKLHLPHSLRAALVASWAFMITSQASAATYTIDDASYSKVTPCCSEMGDWAFLSDVKATLSLYCYQPNQWHTYDGNGVRIHHAGDDLPVTLNLSGRGIDSYLVNLYDRERHAAWILSTRDTPSQVTLNDFQDITISYSHVSNVAGSGPAMGQLENSLYPFAGQATVTLNMVVDTADSFTFAYGDAYSGACFDNGGSTTINNVKNVNFKNNEATLFSESSLSISNVSGTATFDGNKGTVFKESEIVFYNVASLTFSNHESTIFKGSTTTFQECDSISVCSNTGATGSIADGGTCQFVECGSVIIDDNTCTEQEFFTNAIPTFNNCDTVAITNNEGKAGTVIARLLNAEGIRDTFRVDNNLGYSTSADIEADSVLLGGNNVTYANAGKLTVKGQERKANLFSLSDNKGVGYYPHGFLDVGAWVSNFKTARFDGNGIQVANVKFAHLIGSLVLDNVDDISISGNTGYIATKSGGLIGATSEISKFNTLTIENNKLGADIGTKGWNPTMQDGFLSDAVITGKDSGSTEQSSVIVRSNTITGTASLPDDPIGDLAGVGRTSFTDISQVTISDNTFLASSAQAKVSATLFPTVSFSNIGHLAVQRNSGISNAGRAYGGAFGWMIDPASTAHYCFSADKVGNMEISGNAAIGKIGAYGGAIFADDGVSIHSCDAVTISGNYAQADSIADYLGTGWQDDFYTLMAGDEQYLYFGEGALGGGIFCAQDSTNIPHSLRIYNNKNFESRGNYVTDGNKYYLQGIAVVPYSSQNYEAYEAYLSAPQSASLAIYDAIFVGGDLNIGVDYDDFPELYSPEEQNLGRVLISGKYADEDLAAIKRKAGAGAVTQAELEASLSSKVQGSVRIEQGTLEVADNARLYVGDTLNLVGKGAVLKVSSGALVKSHYLNYFDDTNGCVWLNGGTLDIGYGDQQLMNTGMFVDAGNTLKVTAPSVIRTTRLTIASDGHVDLTVSAQNEKTPCLTLQFDGYFWSSEYSLGLGIGAEPFWRSSSSPAYLSLVTSGVLDAGDYILIRVEGYDGSNVAVVQGCNWTKGEYVSGMNEKDSLSWVEDDYGANLVWTIGKTVTPPVNPDPEPEDPTPDNPPVGGDSLTWANAKKAVWQDGATGWVEGGVFSAGDEVTFADGNVTIVGEVEPGEVTINTQKSLAFKTKYDKKTQQYSGAIAGETSVTIDAGPKAKVTMNDGNTYSGGTIIEGGSVKAGGATSFGTGAITLNGGTLDLAGKAVDNAIALEGAAIIKGGAKYIGDFSMGSGADLMKGSVVNIAAGKTVTLGGGTINGTLSGLGSIEVAGDVELGATGKLTTAALAVESGTFSIGSKGLALSARNSILTVNGGVVDSEGKLSTNELQMTGGEISIDTAKAMSLDIKGKTT